MKNFCFITLLFIGFFSIATTTYAQTFDDGCMTINYDVTDSWVQEYEDPFFSDESVFRWYGADNANVDGLGWRGGSCLILSGLNFIGWRTIDEGGSDQAGSHPVVNLFNETYGTTGTNVAATVPQYLALRGQYHGDDCITGGTCSYDSNGFTCLGDPDDYGYDDVLTNFVNYRIGPPNVYQFSQHFTFNHGSSDFGAEVRTRYTSPRPTSATANPSTICSTGTGSTLAASGAVFGGEYVWYTSGGVLVGTGQTINVVPTTTTTYRVYTRNGGVLSPCYNEATVSVINCAPNCVTKTYGGPTVSIDCDELTLPFVDFIAGDFTPGALITDVNVTIEWTKTDGTCAAPTNGAAFHNEVALELIGNASCLSTSLVETGDYSGGADIGNVTTLFDMDQTGTVSGTPTSGNFLPVGNLNNCIGGSPFGSWSIRAGDSACDDPLCIASYSVQICVCDLATNALVASASPSVVCADNTGTVTLSYSGGSGDELHWFEGSCGSGSPLAISIGGVPVEVPSPSTTTTYYARWYSGPTCGYSPGCVSTTITVDPVTVPGTLSGGTSPICEGAAPATINLSGQTGTVIQWERSNDGGATYTPLAGTAGVTAYNSPTLAAGTYYFRAIVQNSVCSQLPTAPLIIEVNANPTFSSVGALENTICSGDSTTIIVAGENGTVQWQTSTDNVTFTDMPGATINTVSTGALINNTTSNITVYYQAIITNAPCPSLTTSPVVAITVQPQSDGGMVSADQEICTGEVPGDIIASGYLGSFIQWERDTLPNFTNPVAFGVSSPTVLGTAIGPLSQTTYFRGVIQNGVCPSVFTPTLTINVYEEPTNTITADQTICTGDVPAMLMGSAPTLGTGSYTYQWQSHLATSVVFNDIVGATSQNYTPPALTASTVYRRVVTSGPCSSISNEITVAVVEYPTITSVSNTNVLCNGDSTANITITSPDLVTYSIDGGANYQISNSFNGLPAGSYNISVINATGCETFYGANPVVVSEPSALQASVVASDPNCGNSGDGSIVVNASGGTPTYTYAINGGSFQSGNTFSGLAPGTYTVETRDNNNCIVSSVVTLNAQYTFSITPISVANVGCPGAADGSVQLSVAGGASPYLFSLDNVSFQSDSLFDGLVAGNYTFYAVDTNGCSATTNAIIAENPAIQIDVDSVVNASCNGVADGAIFISASGSTGSFTYEWRNNGTVISTNEDISGLAAGSYNVTVTGSASCAATISVIVAEPTALGANVVDVTPAGCNGESSGAIDASVSGGSTPYTYSWSDGTSVVGTSEDLYNIPDGIYTLTVTDANGCVSSTSTTVTEPGSLTVVAVTTNPSCGNSNNGIITVNVSGGVGPFTYGLNGGALQTSNVFNNLSDGIYTIQVIDANSCNGSGNAILVPSYSLTLAIDSQNNVSCSGQNDGAVNLAPTGGVAPITYTVNGANPQVNNPLFENLAPGFYTFEAIDANGCSATVSTSISESAPLVITLDSTVNLNCSGTPTGGVYISVSGGTSPYTYLWNNTGASASQDLTNVGAGTYTVLVTDAAGCSEQLSATVSGPGVLSAIIADFGNVSCAGANDGFVDVSVSGGTPPYNFIWSNNAMGEDLSGLNDGTYSLTVTDANGCMVMVSQAVTAPAALTGSITTTDVVCFGNQDGTASVSVSGGTPPYTYLWSTFEATQSISNLPLGNVSVVVTDANDCELILTDAVGGPTSNITINLDNLTDVSCPGANDGSIVTTILGGTAPYDITWSPGSATTDDLINVSGGTYTITVTDDNGCVQSATYEVREANAFTTSMSVTNPTCFGSETGSALVGVNGGTPPYSYTWNTTPPQNGVLANNLAGDTNYTVTITDAAGCQTTADANLVYPSPIVVSANGTSVNCSSFANGTVTVSVSGGNAPYTYQLNGAYQTDSVFDNLPAGSYVVFVVDNNNCTASANFTITQTPGLNISLEGAGEDDIYFGNELFIVRGEEVSLIVNEINNSGAIVVDYNWYPAGGVDELNAVDTTDCPLCPNTSITPTDNIWVIVEAIDDNGCAITDSLFIDVKQSSIAFVPTAFSPNGDGWNDYFEMNILGADEFSVRVFNRWGEEIFVNDSQSNGPDEPAYDVTNPRNAWDGTFNGMPVPEGAYVYQIDVVYFDGKEESISGTITVVR